MSASGLSGFWRDALDVSLDTAHPMLKQLAAQKLMTEGVIRSPTVPAIRQPSFYAGSQAIAPVASSTSNAQNSGDFVMVAVVLLVVFVLLGR